MAKNRFQTKNPLTRAQASLLKGSLKKLLGTGLLEEPKQKPRGHKEMVIKNALNALVLTSEA